MFTTVVIEEEGFYDFFMASLSFYVALCEAQRSRDKINFPNYKYRYPVYGVLPASKSTF